MYQLRIEQDAMIADLFQLANLYERMRSNKRKRAAKKVAKKINVQLYSQEY